MGGSTLLTFLWVVGLNTCLAIATIDNVRGSGFPEAGDLCKMKTKRTCEDLESTNCFGVKLPYAMTSTELVHANLSQRLIQVSKLQSILVP